MGRIVATFFMSLDGVVGAPHTFHFPYHDAELEAAMDQHLGQVRAQLMGRRLYDEWAAYWPGNTDDAFGDHINSLPKYVLSDSLTEASWAGTTIIRGDRAVARVGELRESTDGVVALSGSATTVRWLLEQDLLDEIELLVDPVLAGTGQRLVEGIGATPLRLLAGETFGSGVQHLRLAPTR